jgi:hypothetical protein
LASLISCERVWGHVATAGDCDDTNRDISPIAQEEPADGADNDCDGYETCFFDSDGDGYGTDELINSDDTLCDGPSEAGINEDCDDANADVYPDADEIIANDKDEDCDGFDDCYFDEDEDGYGGDTVTDDNLDCDDDTTANTTSTDGDCDDSEADVHPDADEVVGDNVDDDCYEDSDLDGYGNDEITLTDDDLDCDNGSTTATVSVGGDCNDADGSIHPDSEEENGNTADEDCNGIYGCFEDADLDNYTTSVVIEKTDVCDAVEPEADCDDTNGDIHPGATEICDEDDVDEDCNGLIDEEDTEAVGTTLRPRC